MPRTSNQGSLPEAASGVRAGELDGAVTTISFEAALVPHAVEAWAALGNVAGLAGDPAEAERALKQCTELAPKSAQHWLSLGHAQLWRRRYEAAAKSLERAIELDSTSGVAHFALGQCRENLGDSVGAVQSYRNALRHLPDHAQAKERLQALTAE